jgi:virginiamycin B lyase
MINTKRISAYGFIAIAIIIIVASVNTLLFGSPGNNSPARLLLSVQRPIANTNSSSSSIEQFKNQFCGLDSNMNSNKYVTEYKLPHSCEMPLGITVDSHAGKVWYISTKHGTLGDYNLITKEFDNEIGIPVWNVRKNPMDFSNVWSLKVDPRGSVWFTDEKQNAIWEYNKSFGFNMYKIPERSPTFGTISPVSLDFDSKGNVYFVGLHSSALWFGNTTLMKNDTLNGITRISIPMNSFAGVDTKQISIGSMTLDNKRNSIWISLSALESQGEILRYNITSRTFESFILPQQLSLPVGLAVDNNGNLWATDHGTSIFYMLNTKSHNVTMFATSKASPRIYGLNDSSRLPEDANTLPYWMEKGADGSLWFNEHQGNKIARFDPVNNTLYEYWIPTQNKLWGDCPPDSKTCGIANVLQFSSGQNGQTWFTELSENKLGSVATGSNSNTENKGHQTPFSISTTTQEIKIKRGQSVDINVNMSTTSFSPPNNHIDMVSSGTFTPTGDLGNSTGSFSEQSFVLEPSQSKEVSYIFTPASDLGLGEYTLMLGAQDNAITIMKGVKVNIVN